jgi:hypothetical protein
MQMPGLAPGICVLKRLENFQAAPATAGIASTA